MQHGVLIICPEHLNHRHFLEEIKEEVAQYSGDYRILGYLPPELTDVVEACVESQIDFIVDLTNDLPWMALLFATLHQQNLHIAFLPLVDSDEIISLEHAEPEEVNQKAVLSELKERAAPSKYYHN